MTFRYEIKTGDYCRAMEFLLEHECKGGTFPCPDHTFIFKAKFKDQIPPETLDHYSKEDDFSVRRL